MVAHLGSRTYELLYEEICKIIAEILTAWKKAECYEEVAIHSRCIFTGGFLHLWQNTMRNRKNILN